MKHSLLQLIKEEFINILSENFGYDDTSILDKYFQKKTGSYQEPSQTPSSSEINAELIGFITKHISVPLKNPVGLYKNPKNLNGFSDDCRGVLLNNGDIYLAQNLNALHYNIIETLVENRILPPGSIQYEEKPPSTFVAVQRFDNSRTFTQSSAYEFDSPNYYKELFDIGNQKQPYLNFEFYLG